MAQAEKKDPEQVQDIFSCDVRRPKINHHDDYGQQKCERVHHVLDQLPNCETRLISVTPQEVVAEKT